MVAEKIETLVVFMEGKKKKMKPPGAQAGPSSLRFGLTTKVSIFSATIFVNTTQSSNNNQWNPGHKNKKYERFIMKSHIGDILAHLGLFLVLNTFTL